MIEEDVYCDDVLTQIRATRSALNSVAIKLLEQHMKSCIMNKSIKALRKGNGRVISDFSKID